MCRVDVRSAVRSEYDEPPVPSASPSAQDIDRAFISAMVLHHTAAVEMAQIEVQRGQPADVKQLAEQINDAQEGEIRELQQIAIQGTPHFGVIFVTDAPGPPWLILP